MKFAVLACRVLLGFIFTVFGANGFLHFIPQPPPSSPYALSFFSAVVQSHFMVLIFALQLLGGVALLVNRFVPLALTVLAGVLVNILDFHLTMDPGGISVALFATILWIVTFLGYRPYFRGLFASTAEINLTNVT